MYKVFILPYLLLIMSLTGKGQSLDTNDLKIIQLSENTWVHVTYLVSEKWGKVACNGLIYIAGDKAAIFDTPITDEVSQKLMKWVKDSLQANVSHIIVNHHHIDCMGGLAAFHKQGVPSYAHSIAIRLAAERNEIQPQFALEDRDTLWLNDEAIINYYPGPGHTDGNIVSFLPTQQTLFGGCMVKTMGAGKGNLNDADTLQWSQSIDNILKTFPMAEIIVPGHGKSGGKELLQFTAELFRH